MKNSCAIWSATAVLVTLATAIGLGNVLGKNNQSQAASGTTSDGPSVTVTQVNTTGTSFSASGLSSPSIPLAPTSLTSIPSSLSFGSVQVGNNQELSELLAYSGGVDVNISKATVTGIVSGMSELNPPVVLTPEQDYAFNVILTPPSPENNSGSVPIISDASNPNLAVPLTSTQTPVPQEQSTVAPANIDFSNTIVGTNANQNGTLSASGASVTVSSAKVSGAAFGLSGLSLPAVIPAGQRVQSTVTSVPQGSGVASDSISSASNSSNSPTVESFTAPGTLLPQHTVDLSWTASTSKDVIGYNIYRGVKSGGPYSKINSVLSASTLYSDASVADGQTYYYVTTAVNSSNAESAYASQVQAFIPVR